MPIEDPDNAAFEDLDPNELSDSEAAELEEVLEAESDLEERQRLDEENDIDQSSVGAEIEEKRTGGADALQTALDRERRVSKPQVTPQQVHETALSNFHSPEKLSRFLATIPTHMAADEVMELSTDTKGGGLALAQETVKTFPPEVKRDLLQGRISYGATGVLASFGSGDLAEQIRNQYLVDIGAAGDEDLEHTFTSDRSNTTAAIVLWQTLNARQTMLEDSEPKRVTDGTVDSATGRLNESITIDQVAREQFDPILQHPYAVLRAIDEDIDGVDEFISDVCNGPSKQSSLENAHESSIAELTDYWNAHRAGYETWLAATEDAEQLEKERAALEPELVGAPAKKEVEHFVPTANADEEVDLLDL